MVKNKSVKKIVALLGLCLAANGFAAREVSKDSSVVRSNACQLAVASAAQASRKCCQKLSHEIDEIEDLVESQSDIAAACCSRLSDIEVVLESQIFELAECCSTTDTLLGSLDETCEVIPFSAVDAADFNVIKWLKTIYCALSQIEACVCIP